MHKEILTKSQIALLPMLKNFAKEYYLVGGTAIALHIGHHMFLETNLLKNWFYVVLCGYY